VTPFSFSFSFSPLFLFPFLFLFPVVGEIDVIAAGAGVAEDLAGKVVGIAVAFSPLDIRP
jgi:hypothetical protein